VVPQEAGDGKAKGLRKVADPWELVCKWVTGASVFGMLVLLTILVTEVQEEVEVEGVTHAKEVMRTQFINNHDTHVADPGVRCPYQPVNGATGFPSVSSPGCRLFVPQGTLARVERGVITDGAAATVQIHSLLQSVHNLTESLTDGTTHYEWPPPPEPASEPRYGSSPAHCHFFPLPALSPPPPAPPTCSAAFASAPRHLHGPFTRRRGGWTCSAAANTILQARATVR
jgi:hypothetical protein